MKLNQLTPEEKHVIIDKGTEFPFTGEYDNTFRKGIYVCRQCDNPLYTSEAKFKSGCGWPAFDDEIPNSVKRVQNKGELWMEIQCAKCNGHLGHVFEGEGFTSKNTRHCVNSLSIKFIPDSQE